MLACAVRSTQGLDDDGERSQQAVDYGPQRPQLLEQPCSCEIRTFSSSEASFSVP